MRRDEKKKTMARARPMSEQVNQSKQEKAMNTDRDKLIDDAANNGTLTPKEAHAGKNTQGWTKGSRRLLTMSFVTAAVAITAVVPQNQAQAGEMATSNQLNALFGMAFGSGGSAMDKVINAGVGVGAGHIARQAGGDETWQRAAAGGAIVLKNWWVNQNKDGQEAGNAQQQQQQQQRQQTQGIPSAGGYETQAVYMPAQTRRMQFEAESGQKWLVKDLGQNPETGLFMSEICTKYAQDGMVKCSKVAYQTRDDQVDGARLREQANRGMNRM